MMKTEGDVLRITLNLFIEVVFLFVPSKCRQHAQQCALVSVILTKAIRHEVSKTGLFLPNKTALWQFLRD